jgi:hypothetical protein
VCLCEKVCERACVSVRECVCGRVSVSECMCECVCVCVCGMILQSTATLFPCNINRLTFIIQPQCFLCDVRIELLNNCYISVILQKKLTMCNLHFN